MGELKDTYNSIAAPSEGLFMMLEVFGHFSEVKTVGLAMQYPNWALSIGFYSDDGTNLSSVAGHFAINLCRALGFGTAPNDPENNALRHVIWQALITNQYNASFAQRVGYAHEEYRYNNPVSSMDLNADLNNNTIGRQIGSESQSVIDIVEKVINRFYQEGLYFNNDTSMGKSKLTEEQYNIAIEELKTLNDNGLKK